MTQNDATPGDQPPKARGTQVGHCKQDDHDVYIGRDRDDGEIRHAANTPIETRGWLGNQFVIEAKASQIHREQADIELVETREESVERFMQYLLDRIDAEPAFGRALYERVRGKTLGCWCQSVDADEPLCHGEVIAAAADKISRNTVEETNE